MNILILSWRGPGHPHAGGAEQTTHEHAKAWVKAGHSVTLFTSMYKGASRTEFIDGVKIYRRGTEILGVQTAALLFCLFMKNQYDLVVDQFHGIPFFTPLYLNTRKIAFIHEVAKEVWPFNPWPKPINAIPAKLGPILEPVIFKRFYINIPFFTVSDSTRGDLISLGIPKKNITVIHNGVTLDLPKRMPKRDSYKVAMFLGALALDKGVEDAIRAFADIERKDESWQFWVVGKGGDQDVKKLKELSKELGIDKKTKFWGFVTDKKKFELLSRAFILINPSIHEGWGLVNIEANATGTPVAGYDVHGIRDSVKNGKTGFLVKKGEHRGLADAALKLAKDNELEKRMRLECLKWSKNFSWEKSVRQSTILIESL